MNHSFPQFKGQPLPKVQHSHGEEHQRQKCARVHENAVLVPRSHRHISVNTEVGVVYQGQPRVALALSGNACDAFNNCGNVNSLPGVQADVQTEQQTIKHDVSILRFYPIMSVSFGFKF